MINSKSNLFKGLLSLLVLMGLIFFINKQFFSADTASFVVGTTPSCSQNSDCTTTFRNIQSTCQNPGTTNAVCRHSFIEPVGMCYDLPSRKDETGKILIDDRWGLSESLDIINRNIGFTVPAQVEFFEQMKQKDKILLAKVGKDELMEDVEDEDLDDCMGVLGGSTNPDDHTKCVNFSLRIMENAMKDPRSGNEYFHGFALDEYVLGKPQFYEAVAEAINKFKKLHPKALVMVWGTRLDSFEQAAQDIITATDYYIPEIYNTDNQVQDTVNEDSYRLYLKGLSDSWATNYPGIDGKIIISWGASDVAYLDYDLNPQIDFKGHLDRQFELAKEMIDGNPYYGTSLDGIAMFNCAGTSPEHNYWLAKLFNYYMNNSGDRPNISRVLEHIKNGGVEDFITDVDGNIITTNFWDLVPGSGGIIENKDSSDPNFERRLQSFGEKKKLPQAKPSPSTDPWNVMYFKRGNSTNVIKQNINFLEPGKKYRLTVYSKKISPDYGPSDIGIKIVYQDDELREFPVSKERHKYYPIAEIYRYGEDADIDLAKCSSLSNPSTTCNDQLHLWTKDEISFEAPIETLMLKIHDYSAAGGAENVVDFVQLQTLILPECGNNICEPGELDNCSQDCTQATLTLSADKQISSSGEIITYTATFANTETQTLRNITLTAPIPAGTDYVPGSADEDGFLTGLNLVAWAREELAPLTNLTTTFKVKIR